MAIVEIVLPPPINNIHQPRFSKCNKLHLISFVPLKSGPNRHNYSRFNFVIIEGYLLLTPQTSLRFISHALSTLLARLHLLVEELLALTLNRTILKEECQNSCRWWVHYCLFTCFWVDMVNLMPRVNRCQVQTTLFQC